LISTKQDEFEIAVGNNNLSVVETLLKDKRVDPAEFRNYAIGAASEEGYFNMVTLLLNDHRVNPSDDKNYALRSAFNLVIKNKNSEQKNKAEYKNIVEILWNDIRVKKTLKNDFIELYNILMKKNIKNKIEDF
jgi:hypothetical protein